MPGVRPQFLNKPGGIDASLPVGQAADVFAMIVQAIPAKQAGGAVRFLVGLSFLWSGIAQASDPGGAARVNYLSLDQKLEVGRGKQQSAA